MSNTAPSVLVAGIAGASLGTEIAKALRASGIRYRVIGCDISELAFGHYSELFDETLIVPVERYIEHLLETCTRLSVNVVVPGGDRPMALISGAADRFTERGIAVAINSPSIVARCSDKYECSKELEALGFRVPKTMMLHDDADANAAPLPCVVKPNSASGGSAFVFYAATADDVGLYARYIRENGRDAVAQEYIGAENGEFTVGVLSSADALVTGAIALRRAFPSKLSIAATGPGFLISSGFTQGHIGDYPAVTSTAARIAKALGSTGPMNVQGRLDIEGQFVPFEINPRLSASTYLRAMAGFNEVDYLVRYLLKLEPGVLSIRPGWYLRSLTETFVPDENIKR